MKLQGRLTVPKRVKRRFWQIAIAALLGVSLSFWGGILEGLLINNPMAVSPVMAQVGAVRPEEAAAIVYEHFPDFPKENQYTRSENGQPATDHTLISRFIRYHQIVKERPTRFRFDWKLTFADYLGVNEPIKEERYPGATTLTTNPLENDLKVIRSLNRLQRQELIDLLVAIYKPKTEAVSSPNPTPQPKPQSSPNNDPNKPPLSRPGDANLLLPQ